MAQLQGYFLLYKDDPTGALQHIERCAVQDGGGGEVGGSARGREGGGWAEKREASTVDSDQNDKAAAAPPRTRPRRPLTAHELDKMPFNPQYDWEKDIHPPSSR